MIFSQICIFDYLESQYLQDIIKWFINASFIDGWMLMARGSKEGGLDSCWNFAGGLEVIEIWPVDWKVIEILQLCGSVALWLCSYVAMWLYGYVAM